MTKLTLTLAFATTICAAAHGEPTAGLPSAPPVEDAAASNGSARVAILGYHEFSETAAETAMRIRTSKFRKQMELLPQLGITVISLDDFLAWKRGEKQIPEKSALITLDDGWKSVYTDAYPILKELGYPFTLYLYKHYIDGGGKALTTPMIQEMLTHGASLGSHSVNHPYPTAIKAQRNKGAHEFDAFLRKEMGESKRFLDAKFHTKVTTYAYPGGFITDEMSPLADEFGYTCLLGVLPGKVKLSTPDKLLPRYMILGNYDKIFEFATAFPGSHSASAPEGAIAGLTQTTPYPVTPEAGAIVNSRLPLISANLATLSDFDPATLVMKVSGFGEVPATLDPATKRIFWQVTRRLRQPFCQVSITWKDSKGNAAQPPLNWSFQIDRTSAYLPDAE